MASRAMAPHATPPEHLLSSFLSNSKLRLFPSFPLSQLALSFLLAVYMARALGHYWRAYAHALIRWGIRHSDTTAGHHCWRFSFSTAPLRRTAALAHTRPRGAVFAISSLLLRLLLLSGRLSLPLVVAPTQPAASASAARRRAPCLRPGSAPAPARRGAARAAAPGRSRPAAAARLQAGVSGQWPGVAGPVASRVRHLL
jgi:hypothetical protein